MLLYDAHTSKIHIGSGFHSLTSFISDAPFIEVKAHLEFNGSNDNWTLSYIHTIHTNVIWIT